MPAIGYHAMRMRWCRAALWAFVRRWAAYLVVGALLLAAGGGVAAAQSLCAWLVLPLFFALTEPMWIAPAVVLHALIGAGLVWGMRSLLWPVRWRATERALPIARREVLRSDGFVVLLGLLPWMLPCALGAHALMARDPTWLQPVRGRAVFALSLALVGSIALGMAVLQWLRRAPQSVAARASGNGSAPTSPVFVTRFGWLRALLWSPLWRGPGQRSGHLLLVASVGLCIPALALVRWPGVAGWWLAAYALGAMLTVTRLNALARLEFGPLLQACAPLPLAPATLRRGRAALTLAPLPTSAALLCVALQAVDLRPAMLAAYLFAVTASCAIEARSTPIDPAAKASRWLFCVALMLALGSEVVR
jgi:hypothetical protein